MTEDIAKSDAAPSLKRSAPEQELQNAPPPFVTSTKTEVNGVGSSNGNHFEESAPKRVKVDQATESSEVVEDGRDRVKGTASIKPE